MKPAYKNWMPKGMIVGFTLAAIGCGLVTAILTLTIPAGVLKNVLVVAFAALTVLFISVTCWSVLMYRAFSYDGKRQLSRQIIEGIAETVKLPDGGLALDVGCGSGALTIACAKRNPKASFIGIDRWGKEYASFSKSLCKNNAKAEGVKNVTFEHGDAVRLDFPDGYFDAVTSNYVYHNIPARSRGDRQAYLLETLRTLKKGGTFALHDIFSEARYGDMQAFAQKLRDMGYEKVALIDTTDGKFMKKSEAGWMGLAGSALLVGRK